MSRTDAINQKTKQNKINAKFTGIEKNIYIRLKDDKMIFLRK